MRRRRQPLNLPQPPLGFVDVVLPIVPFVRDVRFQRTIDRGCHASVLGIVVLEADRDVVDLDANEGIVSVRAVVRAAADVSAVAGDGDEVHYYVEGGQPDGGVDFGYVLGESLFGGGGGKGVWWVVY